MPKAALTTTLLLLNLVALGGCGFSGDLSLENPDAQKQDAIISGASCGIEDYPGSVAVLVDAVVEFGPFGEQQTRSVVCGGTLIAPDVVLTAAHCLKADLMTMGFGTVKSEAYYVTREPLLGALAEQKDTSFPDDAIAASSFIPHPEFSVDAFGEDLSGPGDYKDIGLLFLSQPMEIEPVTVITAEEASQIQEGVEVAIVGWGQQTPEVNMFQGPAAGTVGVKHCALSFINEIGPYEMQIGSLGPRKCHGDSGGPSFMEVTRNGESEIRVVGITSHAYDVEDCAKGGVDTRVDAWLDWIDNQMRLGCSSGARSWCEVEGIIAPKEKQAMAEEVPGVQDTAQETNDMIGRTRGCAATGGTLGLWWYGLPLLLVLLRRFRA